MKHLCQTRHPEEDREDPRQEALLDLVGIGLEQRKEEQRTAGEDEGYRGKRTDHEKHRNLQANVTKIV